MDLFKVLPIKMENDQDIVIIKLEMNKGTSKKAEMELTFSGSEI